MITNMNFFSLSSLTVTSGFQHAFERKGVILAKLSGRKATMDDAEEAAIISGAEEVRQEDDDQQVYRVCPLNI